MAGGKSPTQKRGIAWLLIALGAICFLAGGVMAFGYITAGGWEKTEATVTRNIESRGLRPGGGTGTARMERVWCPEIRYKVAARTYTTRMQSDCARTAKYKVGDKVALYYDPSDPGEALIDARDKFMNIMLLGFILALMMWLGAWFLFRRARRQTAAED